MKNKILIVSLLVSFCAFALYIFNDKQAQNRQIQIVAPANKQKQKKERAPKVQETAKKRKTQNKPQEAAKGSNASLAKTVGQQMSGSDYQVSVVDLQHPSTFARLGTDQAQAANTVMKFYILLAIYHAEKTGKIPMNASLKIKKADRVKGEKQLRVGMAYGVAFLRQAMMHGNKTAANALIRKTKSSLQQVISGYDLGQTKLAGTYRHLPLGMTSSKDLTQAAAKAYQGDLLGQHYGSLALSSLKTGHRKLTAKITGNCYYLSGQHFNLAVVQSNGKAYAIAVWSKQNLNLPKLGQAVNQWFVRN